MSRKDKAHPSNPHYLPWIVIDAPDEWWIGRMFRGDDLNSQFPDGTVFQSMRSGETRVCWNGQTRNADPETTTLVLARA